MGGARQDHRAGERHGERQLVIERRTCRPCICGLMIIQRLVARARSDGTAGNDQCDERGGEKQEDEELDRMIPSRADIGLRGPERDQESGRREGSSCGTT